MNQQSGCKAEESKLRTAERLVNLISVYCILSWRIFWMTMINRVCPDGPPTLALTKTEITTLERMVTGTPAPSRKRVSHYLTCIAKLGGYLARKGELDAQRGVIYEFCLGRGSQYPVAGLPWGRSRSAGIPAG